MKHRADSPSEFTNGERLRKALGAARFGVGGFVVGGTIVVVYLASGVTVPRPDLPGFHSSSSGDDHRSVAPEKPSAGTEDRPPPPSGDVSPAAKPASAEPDPRRSGRPTPTLSSAATPSSTPDAAPTADPTPRTRPSHQPGSKPTEPPGQNKPD